MSETVMYTGTLKEVPILEGETVEQLAERVLLEDGIQKDNAYSSFAEQLEDMFYEVYVVTDGKIYEYSQTAKDDDEDIFEAVMNSDGTITYTVKFYNGGCSFNEAIGIAIKSLKPKN